jgi:hypothetical protein
MKWLLAERRYSQRLRWVSAPSMASRSNADTSRHAPASAGARIESGNQLGRFMSTRPDWTTFSFAAIRLRKIMTADASAIFVMR